MSKSLNRAFIKAYLQRSRESELGVVSPAEGADSKERLRADQPNPMPRPPHLGRNESGAGRAIPAGTAPGTLDAAAGFLHDPRVGAEEALMQEVGDVVETRELESPESMMIWDSIVATPNFIQWGEQSIIANLNEADSANTPPVNADDPGSVRRNQAAASRERHARAQRGGTTSDNAGSRAYRSGAPEKRGIRLEPPATPALSPESYRHAIERLAKRQQQILRVDQASAGADSVAPEEQQATATGGGAEQGSVESTAKATHANAKAAALEKERGLRKEKSRIFNPAWEVDSFQWPEVCDKLLRRNYRTMDLVGRNLFQACQDGLQVLAVSSPSAGHGATTVACCLGMLAGAYGLNAVFVDADLEQPSLAEKTNLALDFDWRAALVNELPIEEAAVHSIDDQLTLIPLLSPVGADDLDIHHPQLTAMFRRLVESFDLVLIDAGPLNAARSILLPLGKQHVVDAVATVVDHRKKPGEQLDGCWRRLQMYGIESVGVVENFAA